MRRGGGNQTFIPLADLWNTAKMYLNILNKSFKFTPDFFRCRISVIIQRIYIFKSFKGF